MKYSAPQRDAKGRLRGGNPGNTGGKKGRSGRPCAEFREWALSLRDTTVRQVIEQILRDSRHRDRFKAIEFVARWAADGERVVTVSQLHGVAREFIGIVQRHVTEAERLRAIYDDLIAAAHRTATEAGSASGL